MADLDIKINKFNQNTLSYDGLYPATKIECVEFIENGVKIGASPLLWSQGTTAFESAKGAYGIAYGEGKFVAITAYSDVAIYSTDGINWTQTTMPVSANWYSVAYGDGKFVAVANASNIGAYSTDGINWTQTTTPSTDGYESVAYGDGKFVAVGNSFTGAYSLDGINWVNSRIPKGGTWTVTYGGGKFVAVDNVYGAALAVYSTDGITWTLTAMPTDEHWTSVCYGNGRFVATAYNSQTSEPTNVGAYSLDGVTWIQTQMPLSIYWNSVTYGDGVFLASGNALVSSDGIYIAYSYDGISWVLISNMATQRTINLAFGDNKFIGAEQSRNGLIYSTANSLSTFASTPLPPASIGAMPFYTYGTTDLVAGTSSLETGTMYFVYE